MREPREFGTLLRRLRIGAELSQEELAERARMSVDAIGQLERGRRKAPQRETVDLLLAALRPNDEEREALLAAAGRARIRGAETPPEATPELRHNLPQQLTGLIGREAPVAEISALLHEARLVTVTGAGGIGKTRVAIEVASRQLARWPDGVWFVELASLSEAALVAGTIALGVGAVQQPGETALETLLRHLRHKQVLLILDNCEHVIGEVASIAAGLLRRRTQTKILATSREQLRIPGECVYRMAPLDDSSGVALFTQRAREADPQFRLPEASVPTVVEICRRIDGIPLAIELAAARVRVLSLQQLARKLDERFAVLRSGDRSAASRQQTMESLIDWSYDLLGDREQRFFRRLAVFAGGCTLDGAAAVCADDGDDVLELVGALVDKSLVSAYGDGPQRRYGLLESVRAYALERLDRAGERDAISRRHVEFIAALLDSIERLPRNVARPALSSEMENLRAALSWCVAGGDKLDLGAQILARASLLYTQRLYGEYLQRARYFLDRAECFTPAVQAAIWLGVARRAVGMPAYEAAERAIALLEAAEDRSTVLVRAHVKLAKALAEQNRIPEALQANMKAQALREEICPQDGATLAGTHVQRGFILGQMGDNAASRIEYEKAAIVYEGMGDGNGIAYMRANIADAFYREGDVETAARLSRESLALFREARNWDGVAFLLCNLAEFDVVRGVLRSAAEYVAEAVDTAQRLASDTWLATAAFEASALAAHAGDLRSAARLFGYVRSWRGERAYYEAGDLRVQSAIEERLAAGLPGEARDLLESAGANLSEGEVGELVRDVVELVGRSRSGE